jgi:hypothetical protein
MVVQDRLHDFFDDELEVATGNLHPICDPTNALFPHHCNIETLSH